MRDPPLATYAEMTGYRSHRRGQPLMASVSINALADMHEAMDIEEETHRRAEEAARKKAKAKKGGR